MILLIITCVCLSIYFNYIAGKPLIYEYSTGSYCIRADNKYLDIQSYVCFKVVVWKSGKDSLMQRRCLTKNINLLKDMLNEL